MDREKRNTTNAGKPSKEVIGRKESIRRNEEGASSGKGGKGITACNAYLWTGVTVGMKGRGGNRGFSSKSAFRDHHTQLNTGLGF